MNSIDLALLNTLSLCPITAHDLGWPGRSAGAQETRTALDALVKAGYARSVGYQDRQRWLITKEGLRLLGKAPRRDDGEFEGQLDLLSGAA